MRSAGEKRGTDRLFVEAESPDVLPFAFTFLLPRYDEERFGASDFPVPVAAARGARQHAQVDSTPIRFLTIAILLVFVGGLIALTNHGPAISTARPNPTNTASALPTSFARGGIRCPPGPRIAIPSWFPKNLSLPDGSYALDIELPQVRDYNRAAIAVPSSLRDFAKHIATRWPEQGWTFTHAEVEFIDAEAQVTNADRTLAAAFVARAVCDDRYIQMYLTYGSI